MELGYFFVATSAINLFIAFAPVFIREKIISAGRLNGEIFSYHSIVALGQKGAEPF